MTNLMKTLFPLTALSVFALTGCGGPAADETTGTPSALKPDSPPAVEANGESAAVATADSNGAEQPAGKKLTGRDRMLQMQEQIRAQFKPEVIGPALEDNFAKFQETLTGITDKESATEAMQKLNGFSSAIKQLNSFVPLVPQESRETIVDKLVSARKPIEDSIAKLKENEEVSEVISPVLDGAMVYYGMVIDKLAIKPATSDEAETESDANPESDENAETSEE